MQFLYICIKCIMGNRSKVISVENFSRWILQMSSGKIAKTEYLRYKLTAGVFVFFVTGYYWSFFSGRNRFCEFDPGFESILSGWIIGLIIIPTRLEWTWHSHFFSCSLFLYTWSPCHMMCTDISNNACVEKFYSNARWTQITF